MPYPDLPPNATFWRCPNCGNEQRFRASGTSHVECTQCGQLWTVEQLKAAHSSAQPSSPLPSS
jgi:uncharacterized protein (DUF983 family)